MTITIHEVAAELRSALIEYIEATYHIGDSALLSQRRALLEELGVVHQAPYLESTPRYKPGKRFAEIEGLPAAALQLFETLSQPSAAGQRILYDPPYKHQSEAIEKCIVGNRNLLIMTGTGSGKTESFLMPVLGKLARESSYRPESFAKSAMRAMILYPMNALVNDQLGRLRGIFGDSRLVQMFGSWEGRPPRFARYTSRTPYAGVRLKGKDQRNLKPFADFFVGAVQGARSTDESVRLVSQQLIDELTARGKWPAKPDLERWYLGPNGKHWQDKNGNFIRAVALEGDSELVTRHEVQASPPDLVVTNYSMLEYMLMRPVERTIFDQTKEWLHQNPKESFLLILDEAHLYRGAGGAEVGLLLRRLRDRLDIAVERLQVICATASFDSKQYAPSFASQLTGAPAGSFDVIDGDLLHRPAAREGTGREAELLSSLDMGAFYDENDTARRASLEPFFTYRKVGANSQDIEQALLETLEDFGPLSLLVNETMGTAQPVEGLGARIFPSVPKEVADVALTNLAALATSARSRPNDPSLLPCRVHTFFRGLRGLWVCMDPECTAIPAAERGVAGKLFSQPTDICECHARVLEFYTCRVCGNAYARGYCSDPESPTTIWPEAGAPLRMAGQVTEELRPLDMLLAAPGALDLSDPKTYDLLTGQIDPATTSSRRRTVYLPPNRLAQAVKEDDESGSSFQMEPGVFHKCAVCERKSIQGVSPVQDHETKGDQPFQVLLSRQIQVQPPGPMKATHFAPLRGRKVLAFSDSRQVAARLAPNLQTYSARDSLRPLMVRGWKRLAQVPSLTLRLDDIYFAVLLAAHELEVRLRPELAFQENFTAYAEIGQKVKDGLLDSNDMLREACAELRGEDSPPEALLADILSTMRDRSLGLEALAFASIVERSDKRSFILALPHIAGVTETDEDKIGLARAWFRFWSAAGFWLPRMPQRWYAQHLDHKVRVESRTEKFSGMTRLFPTPAAAKAFNEKWVPVLLKTFAEPMGAKTHRLKGNHLSLDFEGSWVRCTDCKSVHRPIRLIPRCLDCGHASVLPLDPDNDDMFAKRKGFYRKSVLAALGDSPRAPMAIIAAEHTAQLNSAQKEDVFSKAEANELLFQDVHLPQEGEKIESTAIDVLSSTTTMEVGIDIGQLSGVAMRNMPPGRANYQQRAGRAGRRANAIASVVAFGGSDTHDEHFFSEPAGMISGKVIDPTLSLDNIDIARRHVRAFLLQSYHQARISGPGTAATGDLFAVLGKVSDFLLPTSLLNREDFGQWLSTNAAALRLRVDDWLPQELSDADRLTILTNMIVDCLKAIDDALKDSETAQIPVAQDVVDDDEPAAEVQSEEGEEKPQVRPDKNTLLDTLLYKGVLPRYAFPTDVATFHVFDAENSTKYRPQFSFAPSQGLSVALTQYAPGKQVWISGKCYTSGAIYSKNPKERRKQWDDRQLHLECSRCGFAFLAPKEGQYQVDQKVNCGACNGQMTLGPARHWFRPTGFAHPVNVPALTSPDDMPETSYATRAKLTMRSDAATSWTELSDRVRYHTTRTHLLVSNTGPGKQGYLYCTTCGRIEASSTPHSTVTAAHSKPFPEKGNQTCRGSFIVRDVVLGTDFITDVALFSLKLQEPIRLLPADSISHVALRTLCEALSRAATTLLEIEAGEVMAEFRPALTPEGVEGLETEIFLYDTLPGGAGFSKQAAQRGIELFSTALDILQGCAQGNRCGLSCYRCLRTFRNRIDHGALDRRTGAALVEYLLTGRLPPFEPSRLLASTDVLFGDLERRSEPGLELSIGDETTDSKGAVHVRPIYAVTAGGRNFLISVGSPLREAQIPYDASVMSGGVTRDVTVVEMNELVIRKNLAEATRQTLEGLGRP